MIKRSIVCLASQLHALNGGRDKLSERELTFVGVGVPTRTTSGGWRSAGGIAVEDDPEMSAETVTMLQVLVSSRERLEFLG